MSFPARRFRLMPAGTATPAKLLFSHWYPWTNPNGYIPLFTRTAALPIIDTVVGEAELFRKAGQMMVQACKTYSETVASSFRRKKEFRRGFTLIELMIVVVIIVTLTSIAVPNYLRWREQAKVTRAISDIQTLNVDILGYLFTNRDLPHRITDLSSPPVSDPWGNPYQYLNFDDAQNIGEMRSDRFLVPINSKYDLYSMGPDGRSVRPITARASRDDIIMANDGAYIGLASNY